MTIKIQNNDWLLVVDVQYDFLPGGTLAVSDGDKVIPVINDLTKRFDKIVFTQDWHPKEHISFFENHLGKQAFQTIETQFGRQELWASHCVKGTKGANLHCELKTENGNVFLRKGTRKNIDSYSAFFEKDGNTTGLLGFFKEQKAEKIFICGLATDFCVRFTAEDAKRCGLETVVLLDACRAVDINNSLEEAITSMQNKGIIFMNSGEV